MASRLRRTVNGFSSRLKGLLSSQGVFRAFGDGASAAGLCTAAFPRRTANSGHSKISSCKTFSSKKLRIKDSMISSSSWTVLKVLQGSGFRSYFVGGCVRDLILHRVPKDFDVVTTATLQEIKKSFRRCWIVGKRFPVCRVQIRDLIVEVSSFETVAQNTESREDFLSANMPALSDGTNVIMWRNSMSRDFTVNSLFFDPFACKIFDFSNGMEDLRSLTLRTLLPARLSFKEDCAIILRGLRFAARLGLRLTKEIENAIEGFLPAVISLNKDRLMLELNYMLCYGAALPSLFMLKRFGLLQVLLPFQVAYLHDNTTVKPAQSSSMLVKLISNMDKVVSCDRPCDCTLWVSLLAFHLTLANHYQDALVIWAVASVLYYGQWKGGVQFAIKHAGQQVDFVPEISGPSSFDMEELAERVNEVASLAQEYAAILSDADFISKCPHIPSSGLVLISKKVAKDVSEIFQPLANDVESFNTKRETFEIDYHLLGRGFLNETRFALGKIILDTLNDGVLQGEGKTNKVGEDYLHNLWKEHKLVNKKNQRLALSNLVAEEKSKNNTEISLKPSNDVSLKECTNKQKKFKLGKRSSSEEKTEAKKPRVVKVKRSGKIVDSVPQVPDEKSKNNKKNQRLGPSNLVTEEKSKNNTEISLKPSNDASLKECTNKQKKFKLGKRSSSEEETEAKKPRVDKVKRSGKIVDSIPQVPDENLNSVEDLKSKVGSKSLSQAVKKNGLECCLSDKQQNALTSDSVRKSTNKREKSLSNKASATEKADQENQLESSKANTNPLLSDIFR